MKRILSVLSLVLLVGVSAAFAQAPPPAAPAGQKTLAATLDVAAFPQKGQTPTVQSQDEAACYQWAVQNTGKDPFAIQKEAEAQAQQAEAAKSQVAGSSKGAGAKGAVKGAAAGAVVGEVASDDAGKGAATGAAVGVVAGRRKGKKAEAQATQQIDQQAQAAQAASTQEITNFKKAFSACLEGKGYLVKI